MILWRLKTMWLYIMTTAITLLMCNCDGFGKVCKCINHSGTKGNEWGSLTIASNESRLNGYECALIYIRGAPGEIVELRFYDINLRKGCQDEFQIFPHLKESMISDMAIPEEVICAENSQPFITTNTSFRSASVATTETNNIVENNDVDHAYEDNQSAEHKSFNENEVVPIEHRKTLFSSDNIFGLRLDFKNVLDFPNTYFSISGRYRFVDKALFKIDGNLLPTTLCDYQFLPYPLHYGHEHKYENTLWRYFYSPRYPAKYPGHIKCAYKFIGRPNTIVEIEFQEIFLSANSSRSCINSTEKITVYDNKIADKIFVIDVLCNEKQNKQISSTGPNLVIEFESSSNRTTNGFGAKYRFIDIQWKINSAQHKSSENMPSEQLSTSSVDFDSTKQSQRKFKSKLENVSNTSNTNMEQKQRNRSTSICPPGSGNCDIVLHSSTSKNGSIQSPLFPGPYPARTFCRFEFQGNGRQRVQIKFTEFTLPSSDGDDCEQSDTLSVLMPIKGKYEPVETLCGDTLPKPLMSNGPRMLLEFRGRQSGKGNRGFKADFIFLENFGIISGRQIPDYECSFVYNSSFETSGWFHSPNFPGAYPRNIECNYFFHGRTMERVHIRFTYFDVEGVFPCDEDSSSDSVELSNFNSVDRKFQKYCSKISKGFSVKSDGKFFRITFRSNDRLDGTGFRASYTFEIEKPTTEQPSLASDSLNSSSKRQTLNDLILYFYLAISSLFPIANVLWINGL